MASIVEGVLTPLRWAVITASVAAGMMGLAAAAFSRTTLPWIALSGGALAVGARAMIADGSAASALGASAPFWSALLAVGAVACLACAMARVGEPLWISLRNALGSFGFGAVSQGAARAAAVGLVGLAVLCAALAPSSWGLGFWALVLEAGYAISILALLSGLTLFSTISAGRQIWRTPAGSRSSHPTAAGRDPGQVAGAG